MARYYYSGARGTTEQAKRIELSWLKKQNYLNGYRGGSISWSFNGSPSGNITAYINTDSENPNIRLVYKVRRNGEDWKDMDFSFRMESLPCRFGGKKWFFICGLYKNKIYCGRRVRILYQVGDYFGCRHCAELSYYSCNLGGIAKRFGRTLSFPDLEKLRKEIKRTHYRGKPTKKYLKYLKEDDKAETSFAGIILNLNKRLKG